MKSSELSKKQKKVLKKYCESFKFCGGCGYTKWCHENVPGLLCEAIEYGNPFEIPLLPEHMETKTKSIELSDWQKQLLMEYCGNLAYCDCGCEYKPQCFGSAYSLKQKIQNNIPFEISLLPEHREEKMNTTTKCKNCGEHWSVHRNNEDRCPLVDYKGRIASGRWGKTFFEAEESEVDKLIKHLEKKVLITPPSYMLYVDVSRAKKLLEELKELRGDDENRIL